MGFHFIINPLLCRYIFAATKAPTRTEKKKMIYASTASTGNHNNKGAIAFEERYLDFQFLTAKAKKCLLLLKTYPNDVVESNFFLLRGNFTNTW